MPVLRPVLILALAGALVTPSLALAQAADAPKAPPGEAAKGDAPVAGTVRQPPSARKKNRVFVKDIAGLWVASDWLAAVEAERAPHAAARKASPLVINIQQEGRAWPILRTDFSRAVLERVIEIEPTERADAWRLVAARDDRGAVSSAEATYIPFSGSRAASGRFEAITFTEPSFAKRRPRVFVRLEDGLEARVNRVVIAGRYRDEQGRAWSFSEAGELSGPDGNAAYEVSLAASGAGCEFFEVADDKAPGGKRRTGYAWKAGRLSLFATTGDKPARLRCESKPFAVLAPEAGAASS
ncbi:MAG: hypothetical protein ACK5YW_01745 [Betaproteobacteria bacterium]|jgi:hypothetical protein|nr:hypothetical protein [Rhodocyclaceae bacterium]MCA3134812.1 hypothetical protein [Rhodocyclaceae bacterium]MCA3142294.1 hypothetical protein [Rhodocyclaceae bacterium]MCA3146417.1 hypothetical protein [Rhodocyclaceae bacterium]MCE2898093.1 hypothetical protein [Betaproteobacteria bacterium]